MSEVVESGQHFVENSKHGKIPNLEDRLRKSYPDHHFKEEKKTRRSSKTKRNSERRSEKKDERSSAKTKSKSK